VRSGCSAIGYRPIRACASRTVSGNPSASERGAYPSSFVARSCECTHHSPVPAVSASSRLIGRFNPPDFDYRFNLEYGRVHTAGEPVIAAVRAILDEETEQRARDTDQTRCPPSA
jgi:hypothetical protein